MFELENGLKIRYLKQILRKEENINSNNRQTWVFEDPKKEGKTLVD